jgi:hypothetical protein
MNHKVKISIPKNLRTPSEISLVRTVHNFFDEVHCSLLSGGLPFLSENLSNSQLRHKIDAFPIYIALAFFIECAEFFSTSIRSVLKKNWSNHANENSVVLFAFVHAHHSIANLGINNTPSASLGR